MNNNKRMVGQVSLLMLILVVILTGCGDDGAVTPKERNGTINIDQTPDVLTDAGWTMTGPQNSSGSGDTTLTEMPVGTYTLSWNTVSRYSRPSSASKTLADNGTIAFDGTYIKNLEFVHIVAGIFTMGSPTDEYERGEDEVEHTVTLTTPFYMSTTEVTNGQYAQLAQWAYNNGYCTVATNLQDALDGSTEELLAMDDVDQCEISFSEGIFSVDPGKENHPVKEVTWYGAVAYCDWLSLMGGLIRAYNHSTWQCDNNDPYNTQGFRLPTEAEWEYACRGGALTPFNTGECLEAGIEANYNGSDAYSGCPLGSFIGRTVPVSSYASNAFGLYDIHGNVWEWCNDWSGDYAGNVTDPVGPDSGTSKLIRGGGWSNSADQCRAANRGSNFCDDSSDNNGFRIVRSDN